MKNQDNKKLSLDTVSASFKIGSTTQHTTMNAHECREMGKRNLSKKIGCIFSRSYSLSLSFHSSSHLFLTLRDLLIPMHSWSRTHSKFMFTFSLYSFFPVSSFSFQMSILWWPIHYRNVCILWAQQERMNAQHSTHLFNISHVHSCI